ncbi:MAG TPA: bifunctional adenosylcobinamide kinase/adenosylcobinamide-phosphate guanylyltransferase [Steroidobacteraceae bacterium]|nr:bifunctional adenosylcobinamide kinase/adenosylcobinamide-phosphate guanylyltransferase [Steroidobacteraceae bacterium]
MNRERHLVLGGARSGKTRHALSVATTLASARGADVVYVATAEALDEEMRDRIQHHRNERPAQWQTLEAPRRLGRALADVPESAVIIVDCLTLWLSNAVLQDFREEAPTSPLPTWSDERQEFMGQLARAQHSIVLVSNEVGGGIVPLAPVARRFQSEQGWLNQAVASICERVTLVVAGIPVIVK